MKKESLMHRLFGFIDRDVETTNFIDTGHLNMINLPIPHIKDPSKYDTEPDKYKYL